MNTPNPKSIFIRKGNELISLLVNDIRWVKAQGRKSTIKSERGTFDANSSISTVENTLRDTPVIRIHKSYLVNILKVKNIKNGQVHLSDTSINVGRKYMASLRKKVNEGEYTKQQ